MVQVVKLVESLLFQMCPFYNMLCWISVPLLIIYEQIVDIGSSNMCIQTLKFDNDSVGVVTDRRSLNTRKNLIYLTDFSARNERQQVGYERMKLISIRAKVNMFRMYRQLKLDVVKTIQQLRIQIRRRRGKRGGKDNTAKMNRLGIRYINFSNLRRVTIKKWSLVEDASRCWTKFGFGNVQSLKNKDNLLRDYLD